MKKEKIYLVLENGEYFAGDSFGGDFETVYGEVVFNTSITGYLESITDPSYCGQILVQTFPLIGNYGVIPEDFESEKPWLSGYIVRDWCETPSNYRSTQRLDEYFKKENIPAMSGIDTRRLTRIIRNNGVMNGMLTKKAPPYSNEELEKIKEYTCAGVVNRVTRKEAKVYESDNPKYNVVLWDFGTKENIIRCLTQRGCNVTVVPADTKAEEIKSLNPDGIMLSNGPGDPQENKGVIEELKKAALEIKNFDSNFAKKNFEKKNIVPSSADLFNIIFNSEKLKPNQKEAILSAIIDKIVFYRPEEKLAVFFKEDIYNNLFPKGPPY